MIFLFLLYFCQGLDLRLSEACLGVRVFSLRADGGISWVTVHSQCHARYGLGSRVDASDSPVTSGTLLPAGQSKPSATSKKVSFRDSIPSQRALTAPIAPRMLSCLRIKHAITSVPARLDTWPVANNYQGGVHTR